MSQYQPVRVIGGRPTETVSQLRNQRREIAVNHLRTGTKRLDKDCTPSVLKTSSSQSGTAAFDANGLKPHPAIENAAKRPLSAASYFKGKRRDSNETTGGERRKVASTAAELQGAYTKPENLRTSSAMAKLAGALQSEPQVASKTSNQSVFDQESRGSNTRSRQHADSPQDIDATASPSRVPTGLSSVQDEHHPLYDTAAENLLSIGGPTTGESGSFSSNIFGPMAKSTLRCVEDQHRGVATAVESTIPAFRSSPSNSTLASAAPAGGFDTAVPNVQAVHVFAQRAVEQGEKRLRAKYRRGAEAPAVERYSTYHDVLKGIAGKLPQVGPTILDCLSHMTDCVYEYNDIEKRAEIAEQKLALYEKELDEKVQHVRVNCQKEITSVIRHISNRDDEIHASQRAAEVLQERIHELEKERKANLSTIQDQAIQIRDQGRELSLKRSMLKSLQSKGNEIVAENKYLRNICAHNVDLLKEIESMKDSHSMQNESREKLVKTLQAEVAELKNERSSFSTQLKGLKVLIAHQVEELALLRQTNNEQNGLLNQARVQRDHYMVGYTPRPEHKASLEAIDAAAQSMDIAISVGQQLRAENPTKIKTTLLVDALQNTLEEITTELKLLKVKHAVQSKVVEFLREDDFERLQDLGVPSMETEDTGEAVEEAKQSKFFENASTAGALVGTSNTKRFPLHSRCVVGKGMWAEKVPLYLQSSGLVPVRSMLLEEVLLLIDSIRKDREVQLENLGLVGTNNVHYAKRPPLADHILSFFATRYPCAVYDMAYSFHHSLDLCSYAPQVELFKRIVKGEIAEAVYREALELVDVLFISLRSLVTKLGTNQDKKRKYVKRRVLVETIQRTMPAFSEADMLRLKGLIHVECVRHGYGDGSGNSIKLNKEDVPLEVLLDGHLRQGGSDDDLALLGIQQHEVDGSVLSPFGAALFRQVMIEHELFVSDVITATIKASTGSAPPVSSFTPASEMMAKGAAPPLDGGLNIVSAANYTTTALENVSITPQTLFEAIPLVDETKTSDDIQKLVDFIFIANVDGSEGKVRRGACNFATFTERCAAFFWTRGSPRDTKSNSSSVIPVVPIEQMKLEEASKKNASVLQAKLGGGGGGRDKNK